MRPAPQACLVQFLKNDLGHTVNCIRVMLRRDRLTISTHLYGRGSKYGYGKPSLHRKKRTQFSQEDMIFAREEAIKLMMSGKCTCGCPFKKSNQRDFSYIKRHRADWIEAHKNARIIDGVMVFI